MRRADSQAKLPAPLREIGKVGQALVPMARERGFAGETACASTREISRVGQAFGADGAAVPDSRRGGADAAIRYAGETACATTREVRKVGQAFSLPAAGSAESRPGEANATNRFAGETACATKQDQQGGAGIWCRWRGSADSQAKPLAPPREISRVGQAFSLPLPKLNQ